MRIAVIGAGNVGGTLGRKLAAKGHAVTFGVRRPEDDKYRALVATTGGRAGLAPVAEAAAAAELVILATPWEQTRTALDAAGDLGGKIVIDATNPLLPDLSGLDQEGGFSGARRVADWAKNAMIVKTFNTTGYDIMADPIVDGRRTIMFAAGDDATAKATARTLVEDVGFDFQDAGGLDQAGLLEHWAMLWISLAYKQGLGRDFGFALVKR
jgi:predicted dinucleotide-binding enzyme